MACPYFNAVNPKSRASDSRYAMLPLGDAWDGTCLAAQEPANAPDETTLLNCCNMGYARECCPRFPAGDGPDAVRFTIAGGDERHVRLYYVLERDHHPWAHGPLEFSTGRDEFVEPPSSNIVERLGRAYVRSYLRRKAEASAA